MGTSNLDLANLENLTAFWRALGATQQQHPPYSLWTSQKWPHKCWSTPQSPQAQIDEKVLNSLDNRLIFPVWGLGDDLAREIQFKSIGYELGSTQTAMVLSKTNRTHFGTTTGNISTKQLVDVEDACLWSKICAEAFGYEVDHQPIRKLIGNENAHVILAEIEGEAAGTAVLFRTSEITGIHQVGVRPAFRGQGLARSMMESTIEHAFQLSAQHITLQASPAGKPLYDQLGFQDQFEIRNYKRGNRL